MSSLNAPFLLGTGFGPILAGLIIDAVGLSFHNDISVIGTSLFYHLLRTYE